MEDIRISGNKDINGGEYNDVHISGSCDVLDDIKANSIKISGNCEFKGSVDANDLFSSGNCEIRGYLKCKTADTSGHFEVKGDVNCDKFSSAGCCEIKGDLNADNINISGKGEFNNVYGDVIKMDYKKNSIEANEIEATTIEIHGVDANRVCGDKVTITGISDVKVIEYKDELSLGNHVNYEKIIRIVDGEEVEININCDEKVNDEKNNIKIIINNEKGLTKTGKKIMGIVPLVCVAVFLLLGFLFDLWHPGWLVFLLIPVIGDLLKIKQKGIYVISSVVSLLVAIIYLAIGVIFNVWHPTWVMFFIIPIVNIIVSKK